MHCLLGLVAPELAAPTALLMHPRRVVRLGLSAYVLAATFLGPVAPALADVPTEGRPDAPNQTFRYTSDTAGAPSYFRAILEGFGVLGLGYVEYLVSTQQLRQGVAYDGTLFYEKLRGNAQSFDANHFGTNFIGHPLGGTLYYLAARGNRLSVAQSFSWAFTGSLLWEYLGEIGERPSYNDMIATPWGGVANGETFTQLGAFFARGRPSPATRAAEILFGWPRVVHDALDGATFARAAETDDLGLPADVWHDFRASVDVASVTQAGAATRTEAGLAVDLAVHNLDKEGQPADVSYVYDDGNAAALRLRLRQAEGRIVDARYEASVSPVGYFTQRARLNRGRLSGQSFLVGLSVAYEIAAHDYERTAALDTISKVTVLGLLAESTTYLSGPRLRARLLLGGDFAGVRAFALPSFLARHPEVAAATSTALPSLLKNEHYYFALGPSVAPSLALDVGAWSLEANLRWEAFQAIQGIDVDQRSLTDDIARSDRRASGGVRLAVRPLRRLEVGGEIEGRYRAGRVGEVSEQRTERSIGAFVGARF